MTLRGYFISTYDFEWIGYARRCGIQRHRIENNISEIMQGGSKNEATLFYGL